MVMVSHSTVVVSTIFVMSKLMSGFEVILKYSPILGVLVAGCIGYGAITEQLDNLTVSQEAQYEQISHRLDRIEDRLNK